MKSQKPYPTDYNLLKAQDLSQACQANLINSLAEGIHKIKCKYGHNDKKCETCEIKYKDCDCFLEYINFKDDLIEYKCLCCNRNYQKKFDEKERLFIIYKFPNHDINKFNILWGKGVYPCEYMDDF